MNAPGQSKLKRLNFSRGDSSNLIWLWGYIYFLWGYYIAHNIPGKQPCQKTPEYTLLAFPVGTLLTKKN